MNTMEEVFKTWQDATLETWSFATKQVTHNETWFNAMNAQMDVYLATMKKMRSAVATSLEALDLPKKDDLVRLSTQVLAAETRAADCEDRLDRAERALQAAEARIATLEQAILELRQQPRAEQPKPVVKSEPVKSAKAPTVSAKISKSRRPRK